MWGRHRTASILVLAMVVACSMPSAEVPPVDVPELDTPRVVALERVVERVATPRPSSRASRATRARPVTAGAPRSRASILACIRSYEGWYTANTGNGYYGAYQASIPTYKGVMVRWGYDYWAEIRPDRAPPGVQDAFALFLLADRGLQPWGVAARNHCAPFLNALSDRKLVASAISIMNAFD